VSQLGKRIAENIERVIVGKPAALRLTLLGLLAQGHILIEDVPGTGKTVLAKSLARSIGGSFNRIQFTPDMLPSDVTGVSIFNQQTHTFEYRPGPVLAQIVLIDEINRATPKTQAALLEVMEERQVTVDGVTYPMPTPFLVLATQNPIEYEGTFPLPEAQLDRFFLRISLGYPLLADEIRMLEGQQIQHPLDTLQAVALVDEVMEAQRKVREVRMVDELKRYILDLVTATRKHHEVYLGASPRGSLALFRGAQAHAALAERDYVLPDDIKAVAVPALAHRMIIGSAARIRDVDARMIVQEILGATPVPGTSGGR
ncbi:MAG: ATPase associated with various cellular activity, 3, partial [Anaerolineales bacterium]|nr:ATPase associated with various cellular activity, 3 [Anaerolineales bacterium]